MRKVFQYLFVMPIFCVATSFSYAQSSTQNVTFTVGSVVTILSTSDMQSFGLMFPDHPIGFVATSVQGQYLAFGAGGSFSGIKGDHPSGTYEFSGTLDTIAPANVGADGPEYSLTLGSVQPSPDGSDFDRDYAGGGPTRHFEFLEAGASDLQAPLVQIYHGEFHVHYPDGSETEYGGSGMAISNDEGRTFQKIGQITYPYVTRDTYFNAHLKGGLWSDAAMIDADGEGHHQNVEFLSSNPETYEADLKSRYVYLVMTDRESMDTPNVIALARARKADVIAAFKSGKAPTFYKYYNPSGQLTYDQNYFTQPGIGGQSTPIITPPGNGGINSPFIVYDTYINRYILSYQYEQVYLILQTSSDLMHWTAPVVIVDLSGQGGSTRLFDPSIVGFEKNPAKPAQSFDVYYLQRDVNENGALINPRLQRVEVTIN
jgi:hypothetical protein